MGLTYVRCCKQDEPITLEECVAHAATRDNKCEFTAEILTAMYDAAKAHPSNEDPSRLSTTTLTAKCFRSTYLERTTDVTEDPKKLWAAFRGTMFHGRLEQYEIPGSIAEARYHAELPEIGPFSGAPDLVDISRGYLYDYKFTKEVPRWDRVWPDHIEQLNINRWLVDNAHSVTYKNEEFDLTDLEQRKQFVPAEWQGLICVYMDDKGPKPLMAFESIDVPKKDGKGTKKARVPAIWSNEVAREYIVAKYLDRQGYFEREEVPPIPSGFEHQAHPLCGYCSVREDCRRIELETLYGTH